MKRRLRACVEAWPEAHEGFYDPRCCRFPKSCSCTVYDPAFVPESELEDPVPTPPTTTAEAAVAPCKSCGDMVLHNAVLGRAIILCPACLDIGWELLNTVPDTTTAGQIQDMVRERRREQRRAALEPLVAALRPEYLDLLGAGLTALHASCVRQAVENERAADSVFVGNQMGPHVRDGGLRRTATQCRNRAAAAAELADLLGVGIEGDGPDEDVS